MFVTQNTIFSVFFAEEKIFALKTFFLKKIVFCDKKSFEEIRTYFAL